MNTANLQLEGLMLAVAALFGEMKRKGSLHDGQIEQALDLAEQGASRRTTDIPAANAVAILFPIRFLRAALRRAEGDLDYQSLVVEIGRAREPEAATRTE
jgi:hypothetical protein